jgi:hypothetical protein
MIFSSRPLPTPFALPSRIALVGVDLAAGHFQPDCEVRYFPQGWSPALRAFAPQLIVLPPSLVESRPAWTNRLRITHPLLLLSPRTEPIPEAIRSIAWRTWGVPALHLITDSSGRPWAIEAEGQSGWYLLQRSTRKFSRTLPPSAQIEPFAVRAWLQAGLQILRGWQTRRA